LDKKWAKTRAPSKGQSQECGGFSLSSTNFEPNKQIKLKATVVNLKIKYIIAVQNTQTTYK